MKSFLISFLLICQFHGNSQTSLLQPNKDFYLIATSDKREIKGKSYFVLNLTQSDRELLTYYHADYVLPKSANDGNYVFLSTNDSVKIYCEYENQILNGQLIEYDDYGNIKVVKTYLNGKLNGPILNY